MSQKSIETATVSHPNTSIENKKQKPTLEYMRKRDREIVKGIFRFYEVPGSSVSFVYKEYKGDPVERFDLEDGKVYTIPLGVARHLNKNGWYPEYRYVQTEKGGQSIAIGKRVRRFGFQSLEFMDPETIGEATQIEEVKFF